jgi:hypothetical protein
MPLALLLFTYVLGVQMVSKMMSGGVLGERQREQVDRITLYNIIIFLLHSTVLLLNTNNDSCLFLFVCLNVFVFVFFSRSLMHTS